MKKKKYLTFYHKYMRLGSLPKSGLCACVGGDELFKLIKPESSYYMYWGCEGLDPELVGTFEWMHGFNPLRQNIILFLAAMNGEL